MEVLRIKIIENVNFDNVIILSAKNHNISFSWLKSLCLKF